LVVILTRLISSALLRLNRPALNIILGLKVVFLVAGAVLAIRLGPFVNGDAWQAVVTGMVLVTAMAIQNAAHRIHLGTAPPSTLMTGTTTQIMIDLADIVHPPTVENVSAPRVRLLAMSTNVAVFAAGCAAAALLYSHVGVWCFVVPPVLGTITPFLHTPAGKSP
jgi:uncharacterized membrane protein YoaK (UPF0700 family)